MGDKRYYCRSFNKCHNFRVILIAKIQNNLKAYNAQIVDINTNCTGFVTALTLASDRMLVDETVLYSLVIGVELHTRFINPKDKEKVEVEVKR